MSARSWRNFWLAATIVCLFPTILLLFLLVGAIGQWMEGLAAAVATSTTTPAVQLFKKIWPFAVTLNLALVASWVSYRQYRKWLQRSEAAQ